MSTITDSRKRTRENALADYINAKLAENPDCEKQFMVPQFHYVSDVIEYIREEEDYDADIWLDAVYAARLSAPGYMDCTDWHPIAGESDVDEFFRLFVEEEI